MEELRRWYYNPKLKEILFVTPGSLFGNTALVEISELEAKTLCRLHGRDIPIDRDYWFVVEL